MWGVDASVNVSQTLWFQVLWCWQDPPCWTPAYHPLPRKKESLYYISGLHLDLKSLAFLEIIVKKLEFLEMDVEFFGNGCGVSGNGCGVSGNECRVSGKGFGLKILDFL